MSKIEAMIEKVKALINAPSCCAEAKEAANKWLEAVNTEKQDEAAKALIEEIAADIIPIDGLIAFAGSEDGKKIFGEEKAAGIEAHAKKIKAEGEAQYMQILSQAYNDESKADFYNFVRSLDAAKASLKNGNNTLILDKSSPIAQIFYGY